MLSIDPSTHLHLPFPPPQKRQSITAICSLGLDAQDALPSGSRPDGWSYWMRLRQDTGIGTVMDDARIREQSHIQRSSTKRPWEEEIFLSDTSNARYSGRSPTVDATALGNPLNLPRVDGAPVSSTSYGPASRGSVIKRSKLEGNEYNAFSRKSPVLSPRIPPRRPPPPSPINPTYNHNQNPAVFESPFPSQETARDGHTQSPEYPYLCHRCKKLTTQDEVSSRNSVPDNCEICRNNPEYAWVIETAADALTQLVETLRSGISSEKRGVIRRPGMYPSTSPECPPLSKFGLKQTLSWILGRIDEINSMADDLVGQVPAGNLQWSSKELFQHGNGPQDGPHNSMKRHLGTDLEEFSIARSEAESFSDAKAYTRRRSSTNTSTFGEASIPVTRPQLEYKLHGHPPRITFMNPPPPPPPPASTRQLPSPPGRSLASPTSLSFPSPSTPSFGATSQAVNLPLPLSLHTSTNSNYLPPISTTHLPDTALRDYSASLQHEVSVQKIALSSLQGEHDKLLAAFSRSQLRASALEKKHAVSDSEIISLSEEKLRLQQQIVELERDVEELSRSRDSFRQAAVQEGSQYVEIVKKATRLEEIAGEERRTWNKLKEDMERKIKNSGGEESGTVTTIVSKSNELSSSRPLADATIRRVADDFDIDTPTSSIDLSLELKVESPSESRPANSASYQVRADHESVEELRDEIRRLQARCIEVENALRAVQDDGRTMEGILKSLLEKSGSALMN